MAYDKPWKSYQEQLELLSDRGLIVTDQDTALLYLERIGYYRLSGYLYSFKERSGVCCPLVDCNGKKYKKGNTDRIVQENFKIGASFHNAIELYVFDKKLRLLVLDALERIEIALRVDISHLLGKKDTFAYLRPELFFKDFSQEYDNKTGLTKHHHWLDKQASLIARSKEDFIKHNKAKYGYPLPIWVACEIGDVGTLSALFSGMTEIDQDTIANKYSLNNGRIFASWLRSLNYLRNVCAHHSRLWNRNIVDQPKLPNIGAPHWVTPFLDNSHRLARPFLLLCIIKHLLTAINPNSTWNERVKQHLLEFPDLQHLGLNLGSMGAPEDWEQKW